MRNSKTLRAKPGHDADHRADSNAAATRKVWALLDGREVAGLSFRQRVLVGPYLVDFLCPAARLVICLKGDDGDDREQIAWLQSQGYRVLAFDAADVAHNPEAVLNAIADVFTLRVIPGNR